MLAYFVLSLCSGIIDISLLYLSSYVIRVQPTFSGEEINSSTAFTVIMLLSFTATGLALTFKGIDTTYDMLIALILPMYKLVVPQMMTTRDTKSQVQDIKTKLVAYDIDFPKHYKGVLVVLYRIYMMTK